MRHLEPDNRSKFEQALRNDTLVLGRLLAILEEEYVTFLRQDEVETQFDNPNWGFKTAFKNGQKAELQKIISLLKFIKD